MRWIQAVLAITSVSSDDHIILLIRKLTNHCQQQRPGVQSFVVKVVSFAVDEPREDAVPRLVQVPARGFALHFHKNLKGLGEHHHVRSDQTLVEEEFQGFH